MDNQRTLTKYLLSFIEGLKQGGIKRAVISSGSRSTPLSLLVNRDPSIQSYIDIDERSAGFFALGLVKATGEPVALICTSGSAAANYFPAICEAEATNQPLIVLTTDRPAELQGVGAPQAMNQQYLYGSHVKLSVELALPEDNSTMLDYSSWEGFSMVSRAQVIPKGPVHINIPLREPLLPDLNLPRPAKAPTKVLPGERVTDLSSLLPLFQQNGLIIVGEERTPQEAQQLLTLAAKLRWPIIGDPLTNLATVQSKSQNYLHQADLIFQGHLSTPQVVLRFGRLPVTKPVTQWLAKQHVSTILVEEGHQFKDQLHRSNYLLDMTVNEFKKCFDKLVFTPTSPAWLLRWQRRQGLAETILQTNKDLQKFNHSGVVNQLLSHLHDQELFVANSNAIRLVDRLTLSSAQNVRVYGNRGVNGIDGLNSTMAGIVAASGHPLTLLIGDLAFFHDLTGLEMIRRYDLPVTIILLNNNGGGIFSFLAQSSLPSTDFATVFKTPQDLDYEYVAKLYGFDYHRPTKYSEFNSLLNQPGHHIIEVSDSQDCPVTIWHQLVNAYQQKSSEIND
ncbi:2-succinyl-5-enolpyruvyl-6-hydroxy-3-cyclohexene-1-carboxylic-acid synthase [Limosilactobacillus sp. STM2_1]|uniref:2-succinyl-5-enolpyruvyl-6-hydroxy-3-cyclohexene-1-carboxylate synthase n=1 Tax=Limosilactobacillus rudii TaxID=2759755 RepID=A0A7W3ULA6_9LACO|nr:2-succinyl-5-enolpyruvyl-6-hydroxy-3-cyclohexene-1-carboxylic-acid synthase [Limosilactobacillus rudii]MBB1078804.1 2-succinyl-5-enolpyruvyl-6-hydroxy-3-cyclohexene-1-carboxylic-acid synthase [Limosilactobacillus rudii]MBB1097644.1 2-succinyl-5-enolpyruvyl-6-hydroxy-3-cyclohexene-1-carboxylic-acid synthase [Limosilactobacillus rudii]MCD7134753.1 2-succinyl-5-enolpyruvyl-6-hydroxy-3-cyclohexene-1-carboxylic-acid synthase [Limosilactobacillus rudii]